jgi:hypothetical protein
MSLEPVRERPGIRLNVGEAIALFALVVTLVSSFNGWWILPEKVLNLQKDNEKQDGRIIKIEQYAAERAETLVRIDERTRRIEEAIKQVHPQVRQ